MHLAFRLGGAAFRLYDGSADLDGQTFGHAVVGGPRKQSYVKVAVHEVFACLHVDAAAEAIEFYKRAFGATEKLRLAEPDGRIGHAELDFDGNTLMLADEHPEIGVKGPRSVGASTVTVHLHVDDTDAIVDRAEKAGASVESPPTDMFYGERTAILRDPFGHGWNIGHAIEAVSPDEMQQRYDAMFERRDK